MPVRLLNGADVPQAAGLSTAAGWNQTEEDWRMMLDLAPDSCFALDCGGMLAATATLTRCAGRPAWIGMVLTSPAWRRRGLARQLMEHTLAWADARSIATVKLDATDQGQPLYRGLGFVPEQPVERWRGQGTGRPGTSVSPADRAALKQFLTCGHPPADVLLWRDGRLASYLGPCRARTPERAREQITTLLARSAGPWFWDLLPGNADAVQLARDLGFRPERRLLRMRRGPAGEDGDLSSTYAIAGFEFG